MTQTSCVYDFEQNLFRSGDPAIFNAVYKGYTAISLQLLNGNCDPNIRNVQDAPVISCAVYHRRYEIVSKLIEVDCDVDAKVLPPLPT